MKFEASEVNSITNEMIENKPLFENTNFYKILNKNNDSSNYLIAHNIGFDLYMIEKENFLNNYTLIDTKICSNHLLNNMSNYRLSYLKYALGLYNISPQVINKYKSHLQIPANNQ